MTTFRTQQQVACDGVRLSWEVGARTLTSSKDIVQPSLDGIRWYVDRPVRTAAPISEVRRLVASDSKGSAAPLQVLRGCMDGVRWNSMQYQTT